ncbi:MAG TPA: DUF1592 domain-containing protein [Pirellulaceae bacterium]|jgi:mono/diheme cytochrome c family protein|nr:DUF1592 domain-containing protein [Pirellulaceae bacterium]
MPAIRHSSAIVRLRGALLATLAVALASASLAPSSIARGDKGSSTGALIYANKCASCHGANGAGTDDYPDPLIGDKSVLELTSLIDQTMPEGEPEQCVGPDAEAVAKYIYDEFYSEFAQVRRAPPELEFSRLTVRQYEQSVADLVGSFTGGGKRDADRGLAAEYFNSKRHDRRKRTIERRDATVDFDWQKANPADTGEEPSDEEKKKAEEEKKKDDDEKKKKKKDGAKEFSVVWTGSLLAPETGDYEIVLYTDNAVKFWLNESDKPVVDGWVRSGKDIQHRVSMRLLGGRSYPVRLEFSSSDDDDIAKIRVAWKPPHHVEETIPERALTPHWSPEVLVVATPFPPDDRSSGYEKGTAVTKEWEDAVAFAAMEVSRYVVDELPRLANVKSDDGEREKKLREFCVRWVETAFRRPLTDEEKHLYIERQFKEGENLDASVHRCVLLSLLSPRFLYREAKQGPMDDYAVASWLSYALWDSIPDRQLREAAAKGQLQNRDQVYAQAERMLDDERTRAKLRVFLHQWLNVDRMHDLKKDGEVYPGFDERLVSDLRTSLDLYLEEFAWGDAPDFRRLFLDDEVYLNERLAEFYGKTISPGTSARDGFVSVSFEEEGRAGVLAHPFLLAGFAYDKATSPIHRGVFIARNVLGRRLKPPPIAVSPLAPDLHAELTTRERTILQTDIAACKTCHAMINPLGFPLEQFDAVGRFRKEEKSKPIDAEGLYVTRDGETAKFDGAKAMAEFLAQSPETHESFVEQTYQYFVKQPPLALGKESFDESVRRFGENGYNVRKLIADAATTSALRARELSQTENK